MKRILQLKEIAERKVSLTVLNILHKYKNGLDGIGVVEIILILVVLVGLVMIFRDQLTSILNSLFRTIKSEIRNL